MGAAGLGLVLAVGIAVAQPTGNQLLQHLHATIDWYEDVASFAHGPANADEVLYRDGVSRSARLALRKSFEFAENQAQLLSSTTAAATTGTGADARLSQASARNAGRLSALQGEIARIDEQLPSASGDAAVVLRARRDELESELALANARQDVLDKLSAFAGENGGSGRGGQFQQIEDLRSAVPDAAAPDDAQQGGAATQPAAAGSASGSAAPAELFRPETTGVLGLVTEMFALSHKMRETDRLARQCVALRDATDKLRLPLRTEVVDMLRRADALAQTRPSDDPQALAARRQQFDALTPRFTLLARAAVPLSEQSTALDATRAGLLQWHQTLVHQYDRTIRYLLIRLGAMTGAILLLLVVSKLWKRATFRYVTDIRRRRQFLLVRRLIVGGIIIVILVAGVVTEFGSLATYAGLLTAGIAVALQTVILSGVAHFFFLGRYGVRVGDRVTISGITGDVVDIGIFRLYLMELGGKNADVQPTGRIVVFSNSVLFQPTAFYKQIPGAEYNWHEMALTLSPDSDYHLAETRLLGAVESIYGEYREAIERQHAVAKNVLHVQLPPPKPEGRMRLVDAGIEFVVRYPVEIRRATEIDDLITRKLLDTIDHEPKLKLVAASTPIIQAAETH